MNKTSVLLTTDEIKVSVLVPIYNVENYIERCARSLLGQTMKEGIEFIFTDDGSRDRSMEILLKTLEDFPERKRQVTILRHEANKGLAATRKTGFRAARGEYIVHCDSDDWIEPDAYELMYTEAKRKDADIVGCDYYRDHLGQSERHTGGFNLPSEQQLRNIVSYTALTMMVWLRMFRKTFYETFGLSVPDVNRDEDIALSATAHALTDKIGYVGKALYHYCVDNPNSIINNKSQKDRTDSIFVADYLYNFFLQSPKAAVVKKELADRLLKCKHHYVRTRADFNPEIWRKLWPQISILVYPRNRGFFIFLLARLRCDFLLKILAK